MDLYNLLKMILFKYILRKNGVIFVIKNNKLIFNFLFLFNINIQGDDNFKPTNA